jgi:hypothetical protein
MRGHIDAIRAEGTLPSASFIRTYEPAERVHGRVEVTAPGVLRRETAGVDVKGDGAVVPYRGAIFKKSLEPARGESEIDAVRRALSG